MKDWLKSLQHVPLVVLLIGGMIVWHGYGLSRQHDGELEQRIKARDQVIGVQAKQLAAVVGRIPKVDTVRVKDAKSAATWASRYKNLRDSLQASGLDSISAAIVIAADSAVESCALARRSCEAAIAVRDTALWQAGIIQHQQDSLIRDLKKRKPSWFGCVAGGVVSDRGLRPGVGCGIRF